MQYVLLGILGLLFAGVVYYSRQIIAPKVYGHEETIDYEKENKTYDDKDFSNFKHELFELESNHGYTLRGEMYLQKDTDKFVLFCHGITSNYSGMKKYGKIFLDMGYSVLLYDHRNHGKSDRNYTSLGYYEKDDAKQCVDYLMSTYENPIVGVMGESMGAATALQLAAIDYRLAFCIEDCGYSNAFELFNHRAKHDHNALVALLTYPTSLYLKVFYKWDFRDISIINNINDILCPVLFIHGESDDYVPYQMVHDMYNQFNGDKMLFTVPGAEHAMAVRVDYEGYTNAVDNFIKKFVK